MPFGSIENFVQVCGGSWLFISGAMLFLASAVMILGWALWEEAAMVSRRKASRRHAFADRRQSNPVCQCTRRLNAVRRSSRIEAVMILHELNDASAVPALLKALERYNRDVPFVIAVIETLSKLGDARAVPALRTFTTGRHYDLMRAARQAAQTIEARSVLVRPSAEPISAARRTSRVLLRPAQSYSSPDTGILLRAGERPHP